MSAAVLLGGVAFGDASRHCVACSIDLTSVIHSLLAEYREQHDPAFGSEVVGDADRLSVEVEAKPNSPASSDREIDMRSVRALRRETVELEGDSAELPVERWLDELPPA